MLLTLKQLFRSYQGRHYLSRWARVVFEQWTRAHRVIGAQLAFAVIAVGIIEPNAHMLIGRTQLKNIPINQVIVETDVTTTTTFSWPVQNPVVTQGYHYGHPGIDIQDYASREIRPVDEGWVADVIYSTWGYGNHVYINHPNGRTSLYAHFSRISVVKGQTVTRETVLGEMGRTGWATGIHVHLEVYENGVPVNPFTLLPDMTLLASS